MCFRNEKYKAKKMGQFSIIVTGIQQWDIEIESNCKNIALEFSKTHRVLYVNPALDRITSLRGSGDEKVQKRIRVIDGEVSALERINKNLWVFTPPILLASTNWLPESMFRKWNEINSRRFAKSIWAPIIKLHFIEYYLFTDSDMFRSK